MADIETVTVSILDKNYQVNCKPDEVESLQKSAQYLDKKMREVRTGSSVLGLDRIAVMAALNIANDFISRDEVMDAQESNLKNIDGKLEQVLTRLKRAR